MLGSDKDNAVIEYAIGENSQIFASKYLTYLPTKEQLKELVQEAKDTTIETEEQAEKDNQ